MSSSDAPPPTPWRVVVISGVAPIAVALVEALRGLGHDPIAVITPRRRHPVQGPLSMTDVQAPPGVDVLLARSRASLGPFIEGLRPDLVVCWGFPWLIPADVLAMPRLGSVNLHPALLPRFRGPIPMAWTIRAGDAAYGVTWHRMDAAFDTGPVLAQASVPTEPDDGDIFVVAPRVAAVALSLLPEVLERLAAGDPGMPQVTRGDEPYAGWFGDDYLEVDWRAPAVEIHRQVRAWGMALGDGRARGPLATIEGERLRITRTSLADPGGSARRMEAADAPIWIVATEPLEHEAMATAKD